MQGGGPTPVFNTSLYGAIDEAQQSRAVGKILGATYGIDGLRRGKIVDLTDISAMNLAQLRNSPGAALGTTRHKPAAKDLDRIVDHLAENDVRWLIVIGGNGSQVGGAVIADTAARAGYELAVIGVPKTVDNDIVGTDRCPGFGSAARYAAQNVRNLSMDVRSLPQPVSIYETMGRSVGWLAAATALAKRNENDAPHLIYLPEKPFELEKFFGDLDRVVKKLGWAIVVVNEGLKDAKGQPIFETTNGHQKDALDRPIPGGVANHLAEAASQALKIRCRSEKPGLCGRASMLHVSEQDRKDAELVGRAGVRTALNGTTGQMIALRPLDKKSSDADYELLPLANVAGKDRAIPAEWLDDSPISVGNAFLKYAGPIVGELMSYPPMLAELPLVGNKIKPPMVSAETSADNIRGFVNRQ